MGRRPLRRERWREEWTEQENLAEESDGCACSEARRSAKQQEFIKMSRWPESVLQAGELNQREWSPSPVAQLARCAVPRPSAGDTEREPCLSKVGAGDVSFVSW